MTTTAIGKASLALLDEEEAAKIAARELRQSRGHSTTLSQMIAELEGIRDTGVAYDIDEHTDGISAVAIAFRDPIGMVYAVSIPVPSHRFAKKRDDLVAALRKAMLRVEAAL